MIGRLLGLALLALAVAAASSAQTGTTHTFQVRDGSVYLDGRLLPDAVPDGLDLSGMGTGLLEFSGPVTPVIEVDGQVYMLQNGRLVTLEASGQSGESVYILGDVAPDVPQNLSPDRVMPVVEAAYMREVAARNEALFAKMQRERRMEAEALQLAVRIRALPDGDERTRLREDLRRQLSAILALKHEVQAEELALAATRLDALRDRLADREARHDALVEGRLRQLIGQ